MWKKNQKYTKQVLPKSKKTKTSLLNAPTLTKEQRHIRKKQKDYLLNFLLFQRTKTIEASYSPFERNINKSRWQMTMICLSLIFHKSDDKEKKNTQRQLLCAIVFVSSRSKNKRWKWQRSMWSLSSSIFHKNDNKEKIKNTKTMVVSSRSKNKR